MISLWVIIGLIIAAFTVSTLGAAFSIVGLGALFSGAIIAVWLMSGSLEFAKFVLAAYLHQRWYHLKFIMKFYLVTAIFILSSITSMGIFGFLSNAYQSATSELDSENIKLNSLKTQQANNALEITRLNKSVEEIPETRISKRIRARAEVEPTIAALTKQTEAFEKQITDSNLRVLEVKQKVGPLIYVSKVFQVDIDTVVKYLIMLFVFVIDPLAICLVIATSEALQSRKEKTQNPRSTQTQSHSQTQDQYNPTSSATEVKLPNSQVPITAVSLAPDEIIQMHFTTDEDETKESQIKTGS